MKKFLQGDWLGHPLHPALVHIPTAVWPAACFFDILSRPTLSGTATIRTSFYCILLGLIVAIVAAPAGLADWWDIKPEKPPRKIGIYHMVLNLITVVIMAVN